MGEFEKLLRTNFESGDVTYKYTHSENIVITLKDVQDVISEVKQEFPKVTDEMYLLCQIFHEAHKNETGEFYRILEFFGEYQRIYKKWFGE